MIIKIIIVLFLLWNAWILPAFAMVVPIPAASLGANIAGSSASVAGTAYFQKAQPLTVTNISDSLSVFYQPANLAAGPFMIATAASFPTIAAHYLGKEAHVGLTTEGIVNYFKSLGETGVSICPQIGTAVTQATTTVYDPTAWVVGDIIPGTTETAKYRIISKANYTATVYDLSNRSWLYGMQNKAWIFSGSTVYVIKAYTAPSTWYCDVFNVISDTSATPAEAPPFGTSVDNVALNNALKQLAVSNPEELKQAIKDANSAEKKLVGQTTPATLPTTADAPAITAPEIAAALAANQAAVAAKAAADAAAASAADPANTALKIAADQAALTAAQAATQAASQAQPVEEPVEEPPETFPPISSNGFAEPYDPGPYDIPERFSSFLNTVKSSGLFSFSSSFFNSLPGDGSPVYQIEAGQYGSHTIDLSQTMSTGLAVLKTILLACFGFLSIRAVIMKR